ncbi:Spindle pole body component KRE28 [Orchesella cincta]|uniref:Spindle pole body component KRE28 n=1 Tax=Orchesella cincta TaxID=48709 RepID=A0A1D2N762_ORCCI|nr:Spindle pole body component KRE28 [Orchesella cincta]
MSEASTPVNATHKDDCNAGNTSTPVPDSTTSIADENETVNGQMNDSRAVKADLHEVDPIKEDEDASVEQNGGEHRVSNILAADNEDPSPLRIGNTMAVASVNAPTMTYQQDPSHLVNMFINGFQQMTLQLSELTITTRQVNERTEGIGRGQAQVIDELAELRAAQEQTREDVRRNGEQLQNLEQSVNQLSEGLRAFVQEMNRILEEQERRGQETAIANRQPGQANLRGWRSMMQAFLELSPFRQFLVVLGVVAVGWLSVRVAIWAYPYIVEAVIIISEQFTNLMETAAVFLRNINWNEYIRRFANMGADGYNFEGLMNDPLTQMMNAGLFSRTILIFIVTLLEILRSRGAEDYNI